MATVLDRLDRAVGRPRGGDEVLAEHVDRLVVEGVDHRRAGLEHARRARARGDPHGVHGLGGELGLAVALDVLVQRAAAGDVERLRPAADAEQRHPRPSRPRAPARARSGRAAARSGRAARARGRRTRRGQGPARRTGRCRRGGRAASPSRRAAAAARRARRRPARWPACRSAPAPSHAAAARRARRQRRKLATSHLRGGDADERGHRTNAGQRAPILNRRCPVNTFHDVQAVPDASPGQAGA